MTDRINDGGPAFPSSPFDVKQGAGGMTLRQWYAGKALAGCADAWLREGMSPDDLAEACVETADAMIAALNGETSHD